MLGRTAGGLFWMFRYLERAENTARLIEAGFRIALTRPGADEWGSVLKTAGAAAGYTEVHGALSQSAAIDYMLRDGANPSSVMCCYASARQNARMVRTAITREVWEAVNDTYLTLKARLARPVPDKDLPEMLGLIRQQSALVRGALHGSMMRDDTFDFCRLGTFLERADNTARILDVKYYVLLPSFTHVGSKLDNVQWEVVLRSVAGARAFAWLNRGEVTARGVTDFLVFDPRMPRSLRFAMSKIQGNLNMLEADYMDRHAAHDLADAMDADLRRLNVDTVFDAGLHDFLSDFLDRVGALARAIETDYRFAA
ncbi:MAG: alpha-E domain-containing protein [Pseudomonadota bacterium]